MKSLLSIAAVLMVLFVGCSEQMSINSPVNNITAEPNWIAIPHINCDKGMSVVSMPIFQASKEIDGKKGGSIKIDERYPGGPFGEIKVKAELSFPSRAFEGTKLITMVLDTRYGSATFTPHSIFNKDVKYNAEFIGLDLSGININNVDFVYQTEDGRYEYIERSKIEVGLNTGKLLVKDAKLPHFSRYGFVN